MSRWRGGKGGEREAKVRTRCSGGSEVFSGGWEDVDIRRGAWSAGLFNHCRLGVNRLFGADYLARKLAGGLGDAAVSRISEHAIRHSGKVVHRSGDATEYLPPGLSEIEVGES